MCYFVEEKVLESFDKGRAKAIDIVVQEVVRMKFGL